MIQNSTKCIKAGNMDVIPNDPNKLTNTNPSCYDLEAQSYKGFCTNRAGDTGCPLSPAPYNAP